MFSIPKVADRLRTNLPFWLLVVFQLSGRAVWGDPAETPGQLAVGQDRAGHLQIFKVDKNGELRRRAQKEPNDDWSKWSSLGGSVGPGITLVNDADGGLNVFAVDKATGALEWIHQKSTNGSWSGWIKLGGNVEAPVAVGRDAEGGLEVFGVSTVDASLRHLWQTNGPGDWSAWAGLGGALAPGLAVAANDDGRLELFGVDAHTKALLHCAQARPGRGREWAAWQSLGGTVLPGLTAGRDTNGTLEVFAVGATNGLVERIYKDLHAPGGIWSAWEDFGPSVVAPGVTLGRNADGRLELFAVDARTKEVLHRWQVHGTAKDWWPNWDSLGGQVRPFLAVGRNNDGSQEVFAIDTQNGAALYHKRQISANSDWLDWFSLDHSALPYSAHTWQTDQGLPHNLVQAIAQTPDGYIWVGTPAGLARFDGVRFVVFDAKNTPALADSHITSLYTDRAGALWIGTWDGLVVLKNGVFKHYGQGDGLVNDRINVITQSHDGSLWIGTQAGLSQYQDGVFKNYTQADGLLADWVRAIYEDRTGYIWIGSGAGLNRWNSGRLESFTTDKGGLPNNSIRGITQDRGGRLWIGSDDGMIWHHVGAAFYAYNRRFGLSDNYVSSVCEDRDGNLWVGTYSGLNRFRDGKFFNELNNGVPYDKVNAIFEDRDSCMWIGSNEGLSRLTPKRFSAYDMRQGLSHNNTVSVLEDHAGNLWAGTWGGGLNELREESTTLYCATNGLPSDQTLALCEDRDGSLWIGEDNGGGLVHFHDGKFTRYAARDGLLDADARVIYQDAAGRLWIGTSRGLSCWQNGKFSIYSMATSHLAGNLVRAICEVPDGSVCFGTDGGLSFWRNGRFSNVTTNEGLSDNVVTALYADKEQKLWIGTANGGLNCLSEGRLKHYTMQQGLFSDEIFDIVEDDYGWLWMTSSKGVFRVRKSALTAFDHGQLATLSSVTYGIADGMESTHCNGRAKPAVWKAQDGRLWFATSKGLVVVNPNIRVNETPPHVFIEELLVDKQLARASAGGWLAANVSAPGNQPLVFPPGQGELEFQFTALDFEKPEKDEFKYMLKGFDPDWVDAGAHRTAGYNNLPPGRYVFSVKACNANGVWSQTEASVAMVLQPHFWQTWWFFFLAGASCVGAVYSVARARTRAKMQRKLELLKQQHAIERERGRIAKDIHDELGSSLTRIMMLGERVQENVAWSEESARCVQKMVASARGTVQSLDEIVWAVNPENDTLDGLVAYINQFTNQFFESTNIVCRLEMPVELSSVSLVAEARHDLFLMVKEALTNILRHARATEVRVQITEAAATLVIVIEDNGGGFDPRAFGPGRRGHGLENMHRRAADIGGEISIASAGGQGTRITISMPLPSKTPLPG